MFKLFPATITHDGRKVPLIKGWQDAATTDSNEHRMWQEMFGERLKIWGIPTGPTNGILVLDVDIKENGLETLKTLEIPTTLSQRTISGGIHFFFKYPQDGRYYGNKVKTLKAPDGSRLQGLDTRGAGGWAAYYGFIDPSQPIADAPAWLIEQAARIDEPANTGELVKFDPIVAMELVRKSLDLIREAPPGESNNVLNTEAFKLGQLVAGGALRREYAEEILFAAAMERGKPVYEARATIKSGIDGGMKKPMLSPFGSAPPTAGFPIPDPPVQQGPPPRWTPEKFSREDLLNHTQLRKPQLFQDWSTEDIHITTADGGTGKTTLKLYEAICLALGVPFLGFPCLQSGRTLFITGEDTAKKLGAMIGKIVRQIGLFEPIPGNEEKIHHILESVVVKKDAELCLIVKDRSGFIHVNSEAMNKVMQAVDDIKPKMIVFDPISSFWGSEQALNDMNKAVTKFMSELTERSGACVEMINHMGKSSSANKDMSQFAGRGGSGLPSNARVSRVLRGVSTEEFTELTGETLIEGQSAMLCNVNKFTDGSPLYNKPFLIVRNDFIFHRKNLTPQKIKEAENQLNDQERVFQFVKEQRALNKYPTEPVIVGYFTNNGSPIPKVRIVTALKMLQYSGYMGESLKSIDNPDMSTKDKAFVIIDGDGKEI